MATFLKYIVELSFPIPSILLVLMLLPLPRPIQRRLVYATNKVMNFKFLAGIRLIVSSILFMLGAVIHYGWVTYTLAKELMELGPDVGVHTKHAKLGAKWRQERNFWIVLFGFAMWLGLWRVYTLNLQVLDLCDENRKLKGMTSKPPPAQRRVPAEVPAPPSSDSKTPGPSSSSKAPAAVEEPSAPPAPSRAEKKAQ